MGQIRDYKCSYDNSAGIVPQLIAKMEFSIPEVYQKSEYMAALSKALQQEGKQPFCQLPFCHTLEAEAMGGIVNYGDERYGPRAKDYICQSLEDVLKLPKIDVTEGRVAETLQAARILIDEGYEVVLMLSGPFTILNVLLDSAGLFRGLRKEPELLGQVFNKIGDEIVRLMQAAQDYGIRMFSYADSAGSVNIIGPKLAGQVVEEFTYGFMKKLNEIVKDDTLIMLCPKTALALIGTGKAEWIPHEVPEAVSYQETCMKMRGKLVFVGQTCMKSNRMVNGVLQELKLI